MAKTCKAVCEKLLFAILSGALVITFTVPGSAQERIRLSYSALSPSTAFLWIPKEKGFFKKHGLEVEILLIESGSLTSQALASGEIGIADNAGAPGDHFECIRFRRDDHYGIGQFSGLQHGCDKAGQRFGGPQKQENRSKPDRQLLTRRRRHRARSL